MKRRLLRAGALLAHGVFVFLDPLVERDVNGLATVVGSRVVVQAA